MTYRLTAVSPAQLLSELMRCQSCSLEVEWSQHWDRATRSFACPSCGGVRALSGSASSAQKLHVFDRDNWLCHRCGLEVDASLPGTHPFGPVADHFPISRLRGGPTVEQNLRLAHYLCNNTMVDDLDALLISCGDTAAFRAIVDRVRMLPLDVTRHVLAVSDG